MARNQEINKHNITQKGRCINLNSAELEKIAKEKRNEYYRKWRAANKDKVKEINKRYWQKKALQEQQANNAENE